MKKTVLLNGPISAVIAELGHTDSLVIADAGLPIPAQVKRIDVALSRGMPSFMATFNAVSEELCVERVVIASEMATTSPEFHKQFLEALKALEVRQKNSIKIEEVSHEAFKDLTKGARAIVRTGESTPYANAIFYAGVSF